MIHHADHVGNTYCW